MTAVALGCFIGGLVEFVVRTAQKDHFSRFDSLVYFFIQLFLVVVLLALGIAINKERFDDLVWSTHFGYFFNLSFFIVQNNLANNINRFIYGSA
jgi:ethanolamine transporter EutH